MRVAIERELLPLTHIQAYLSSLSAGAGHDKRQVGVGKASADDAIGGSWART